MTVVQNEHVNQYIWSLEDLGRLVSHEELRVRRWSVNRLVSLYPETCGLILSSRLAEDDFTLWCCVVEHLASLPDATRYEQALLKMLYRSEGDRFAVLADGLESMGSREVARWIYAALGRKNEGVPWDKHEFYFLASALGKLGGTYARQWLWEASTNLIDPDWHISVALRPLVRVAAHWQVSNLISVQGRESRYVGDAVLSVLADALGEGAFHRELTDVAEYLDDELPTILDDHFASDGLCECVRSAWKNVEQTGFAPLFEAAVQDAQRALEAAGCDPVKWYRKRDAGEVLSDSQWKIALSLKILDVLAQDPASERADNA